MSIEIVKAELKSSTNNMFRRENILSTKHEVEIECIFL